MITCRSMKLRYPKQLTYDNLAYMLQATPMVQEKIKLLSQFVLEYPRLHVGSSLLADLIHLYQWLHRELAHTMTKETATKLTVAKLNKQLSFKCPDKFEEYETLFQRVSGACLLVHLCTSIEYVVFQHCRETYERQCQATETRCRDGSFHARQVLQRLDKYCTQLHILWAVQ